MDPVIVSKGLAALGNRIVIGGLPRAGKTTLADRVAKDMAITPLRTDSFIGKLSWSDASEAATTWFDAPGPWIVEGVAAVRALRKWLRMHPEGKPCDVLIWNEVPFVTLSLGQATMAKGCQTVLREIHGMLDGRGVKLIRNGARQ